MLVAAVALAACGEESTQEQIGNYILAVNAIQREAQPAFARANKAYADFSQGKLSADVAARRVAAAERSISATRDRVDALNPPAQARLLHNLILRSYDANGALAHETTLLARYLPEAEDAVKPLPRISERLRRRLAAAAEPDAQARALASYADGVDGMLADLEQLEPPPILVATHRAQVARLTSARRLAGRLRAALAAQDAQEVARLLKQFRNLNARRSREGSLADASIRAYNERYRAITTIVQSAQRERLRLERSFD